MVYNFKLEFDKPVYRVVDDLEFIRFCIFHEMLD